MPIRSIIVLAILCCVLTTSHHCYAAPINPPEPTYRGKTLKEWLDTSRSEDSRTRQQAAWALSLGPFNERAVPTLIEMLKDKNDKVRDAAIDGLAQIGKDAAPAVPYLEALIDQGDERMVSSVCSALSSMSREGAQALVRALKHESRIIKEDAARAMRNLDAAGAKEAAPNVIHEREDSGAVDGLVAKVHRLPNYILTDYHFLLDLVGPCSRADV
ncbi:MAG TPA: HEAT repeat domain-containing protein [Gemmataceae bacterium]|nr:HEAT repeat domain-containing protein [Gemmataceae bacterium]